MLQILPMLLTSKEALMTMKLIFPKISGKIILEILFEVTKE
jgi:hypothetical protein